MMATSTFSFLLSVFSFISLPQTLLDELHKKLKLSHLSFREARNFLLALPHLDMGFVFPRSHVKNYKTNSY